MIKIIVGTETGTAEFVADDIFNLLQQYDLDAEITLSPETTAPQEQQLWIVCTATHGAGDVPNNLKQFEQWLTTKPDLSHVKYIMLGLGDSSYDRFCGAAEGLNELITAAGGDQLTAIYKVDAMDDELPEDLIIPWLQSKIDLINQ